MKKFFNAIRQFFKYLFLTPSWGSKKRQAQQEYEENLDRAALVNRLREFIEYEGRSCSMDFAGITPEYIQRMWGETIPIDKLEKALAIVKAEYGH